MFFLADPVILLLGIGALLVAGWLVVVLFGYISISGKFQIHYEPLTGGDLETVVREALSMETIEPQWLVDRGFDPAGGYKICHSLKWHTEASIVIWKLSDENTFLFVTDLSAVREPAHIEFHTPLKDGELMTGSTRFCLAQPPWAGYWTQAFESLDMAALYERHSDALMYIMNELRQPRDERPIDPIDLAKAATSRGNEFVRRQRFWPLRMPYWTVIVLYLMLRRFNKTVREQVAVFGTNLSGRWKLHPSQ